ncbi:MAG: class I SAM-dependent methyltransferase [Bacteroidales bacterium]|nr:class I SAM-dependent methyltransferase [Bacteroidales bacterium]
METTQKIKEDITFRCPVCGMNVFSYVLTAEDWLVSKEKFDIYVCQYCKLRITHPQPKIEKLSSYYESNNYVSHNEKATGLINRLFILARHFTVQIKVSIVKKYACGKILMDIGAGSGSFVAHAIKKGFEASGVEVNENARLFCQQHYGIELYPPSILKEFQPNKFDALTLWHVLEHISDFEQQIDLYHQLLRKKGVLILALPNFESYDAAYFKENWAAWDVPRHLWHFSPNQIQFLSNNKGFTLEKILPMMLDVYYISMLSFRNMSGKTKILTSIVLSTWWNLLALKSRRFSSLIYVLRKL